MILCQLIESVIANHNLSQAYWNRGLLVQNVFFIKFEFKFEYWTTMGCSGKYHMCEAILRDKDKNIQTDTPVE